MRDHVRSLDRIKITSPCDTDWDSMTGNDQVRFCEHCHLHVTDLSGMTRHDAMSLVARSQGRLCVRYIERSGGRVITRQVPEQLYRIGRRASRLAAGAFTATLSLSSASAQTKPASAPGQPREFAELIQTNYRPQTITDEFAASITGTIKTSEGALVSDATVVLVDRETGEERQTTSWNNGQYVFQFLPQGDYLLWVRKSGFATARDKVQIHANVDVRKNMTLEGRMLWSTMGAIALIEIEDPLIKAVSENDLENVRILAFADSDINANNRSGGMSALTEAVLHGNREIVQVLLAAGADVNVRSSEGRTALMSLVDSATPELIRDLISAGAKLNARDDVGDNPLMNAASGCKASVLKELIRASARIDATNSAGETALFFAARTNSAEVVSLLVDAGVTVNSKNEDGRTALMAVAEYGGDFEKFKTLVERGAETDQADVDGKTALILAAANEDSRLVKLLIEMGADVNAKNNYGDTALMVAAEAGPETTLVLFISAGTDLEARDQHDRTPLMRAAISGSLENVQTLLNAGADVTAKDKDGKTALTLAREAENDDVANFLRLRGAPEW